MEIKKQLCNRQVKAANYIFNQNLKRIRKFKMYIRKMYA